MKILVTGSTGKSVLKWSKSSANAVQAFVLLCANRTRPHHHQKESRLFWAIS